MTLAPELTRRQTLRAHVLAALTEAGPAGLTNAALVGIGGLRAPARVHELQREGHTITVVHEYGGQWRYTLVVAPAEDAPAAAQEPPQHFVSPVGMPVYHDAPKAAQRPREAEQRGLF